MVTDYQLDLLRHTLGIDQYRSKRLWGYRNRFCATIGSYDDLALQSLVEAGLAEEGRAINEGTMRYYRATESGCKAAGLGKAATKRAMEWSR